MFTESHDEDGNNGGRLPHDIDPQNHPQHPDSVWAKKRSTLGAAIMFTTPGIPMMFQGQEILEDHWFTLDRTPPVAWTKETRYKGIWMMYQDLIRLRRNGTSTTGGLRCGGVQVHHLNDIDKVIAYHRWAGSGPRDDVLVVANFADRRCDTYTVGVPRGGTWQMRFCSDDARYDDEFDGHCPRERHRRSTRTMTACRRASTCRSAGTPRSSSAKIAERPTSTAVRSQRIAPKSQLIVPAHVRTVTAARRCP